MSGFRQRLLGLVATVAVVAAGGCKTDSPPGDNDAGTDAGTYADTTSSTDTGTGAPQQPIAGSIEVGVSPDKYVYSVGSTVTGDVTVYDRSGSEIADPSTTWSVSPSDAAESVGSAQFELKTEGEVTLEACATLEIGQEVCGTTDVLVDAGPPSVEITSPKPGAFLGGSSGAKTITVKGKVTDSHGTLTAQLNGEPVELADDGTFETEIPATFGTNNLRLTASDGLNKTNPSDIRQVVWAPGYEEVQANGSKLTSSTDNGIGFNIGQNFFDDAQPPKEKPSESKIIARDLADILNLIVSNINFAKQLPNPLIDNSSATLEIDSVNFGDPVVVVDLTDEGLNAFIHIDQVILNTSGSITIEGESLSLNGSISGRISSFVDIKIERDPSTGEFSTTVETLELSIDELVPDFVNQMTGKKSKANALFKLAESTLRTNFEERLKNTLESEVVSLLPSLLDDQLNSLQKTLADQSFEFGSDVLKKTQVDFAGEIDTFELAYREAMTGLLQTDVSVNGMDTRSSAPGTPLIAPNSSAVPWFDQSRLQIALRMRFINGLLTALWKSGFLDLDLKGSLPDQYSNVVDQAKLKGKLPAVIRPARGDEPHDLIFELGQLELDTLAQGKDDLYGLRIEAGIDVSLQNNKLKLSVPDNPELETWVIESADDGPFFEPDALESLIINQVWPSLQSSIQDGLSISLPAPSLSTLQNVAPTLSNLMVQYNLPYPVTVRNGYLMLDAEFRGVLPL